MPQFRVFYMRPDHFRDLSFGAMRGEGNLTTVAKLNETHVELRTIEATDFEDVFRIQQAHNWAEDYKATNKLLKTKGLGHTSMSVGDVCQNVETGKYYLVASFGFKLL